jgi:hypothetical protein
MATESNAGTWGRWYSGLEQVEPYGDTATYQAGADWLAPCALVEDWGCGKGWLRNFIAAERYRGIDGSASPFADEIADLTQHRSQVPGLFMRHVLEHNPEWSSVLDNALASFTERMALILFTPLVEQTRDIQWEDDPGVPNLAFRLEDLTGRMGPLLASVETIESATQFGTETVLLLERP